MKTLISQKWNDKASDYSAMASSKDADAYEYEINFPSILSLCPKHAKNVLDMGCGDGGFTNILAEQYQNIVGADVSPNMIEIARSKYPALEFMVIDLDSKFPPLDQSFDLVVMKLVLMFVEDLDNVASELSKILLPNGNVIISVPHPMYWTAYYLQDKYGYKSRPNFKVLTDGYFTEKPIVKAIGSAENLVFGFIHRTLSSYINPFTKHGFVVEKIDEPRLSEAFLAKHPEDRDKMDIPMRLNVLFKKTASPIDNISFIK